MNDHLFRIAFFALFCVLIVLRGYYKARAGSFFIRSAVKAEGVPLYAFRAAAAIPLAAALFLYIFRPEEGAFWKVFLPFWARFGGIALGLLALAFLVWTHQALGTNFNTSIVIGENQRLVVSGPYRLVRHPMYVAYVLLFLAAFLMTGNWGIGAGGMGVIAILMTARLAKEEASLVERFGTEYVTYCGRTGKFFPRAGPGSEKA